MASEEDDGKLGSALAQTFLDPQTVDFGHRQVQHETGGTLVTRLGQELPRAGEAPDLEPLCAEQS